MADKEEKQGSFDEKSTSNQSFFGSFKERLRSLSRVSSKSTLRQSPSKTSVVSPERRVSGPSTPDLATDQFGYFPDTCLSPLPIEPIDRCLCGKFHTDVESRANCSSKIQVSIHDFEGSLRRRPSAGSSVIKQPGEFASQHGRTASRTSGEIHALGSAANLRNLHQRLPSRPEDNPTVLPHLTRAPSYLDFTNPASPVPRKLSTASSSLRSGVANLHGQDDEDSSTAQRRPSVADSIAESIQEEYEEEESFLFTRQGKTNLPSSPIVGEDNSRTIRQLSPRQRAKVSDVFGHQSARRGSPSPPSGSSSACLSPAEALDDSLTPKASPSVQRIRLGNFGSRTPTPTSHSHRKPTGPSAAADCSEPSDSALTHRSSSSNPQHLQSTCRSPSGTPEAVNNPETPPHTSRDPSAQSPPSRSSSRDFAFYTLRHSPEQVQTWPEVSQSFEEFAEQFQYSPQRTPSPSPSLEAERGSHSTEYLRDATETPGSLHSPGSKLPSSSEDLLPSPVQPSSPHHSLHDKSSPSETGQGRDHYRAASSIHRRARIVSYPSPQVPAPKPRQKSIFNMASRPESMMVQGGPREFKKRAVLEASQAQDTIDRWFASNENPFKGKYEFKELIGKGSYGRVYKSLEKSSGRYVAIKVLLPDEADIALPGKHADINLQDAMREINILERLKQSGAMNVNDFIEAGTVHSQLWLVSDYCSGGSLSTLKRAAGNKLEERYVKVIARELAKGLASVHDAGVIHRDIKCGNVMVSEEGDLRIIDFGVSGILQSNLEEDKRKTIIGTLHWMAPEIQFQPDGKQVLHGAEVDVWAYGITLYECAMGIPPNATVGQVNRLRAMARQNPPRLPEDKGFSAELRDLVAFCCNPDVNARPTMKEVCQHPYNLGTETEHPTHSLQSLVEIYYLWERSGGNRQSLWQPGGAQQAQIPSVPSAPGQDEWVFSTTVEFDRIHGDADESSFDLSSSPPREADEFDADAGISDTLRPGLSSGAGGSAYNSRADQDAGARRGARFMAGLFDQSAAPYQYGERPISDLPLRSGDSGSSLHRKELSVSSNDGSVAPALDMSAIEQKKADKRATMAWKWGDNFGASSDDSLPPTRPGLPHAKTFAIGENVTMNDQRATLNLDELLNPGQAARQTLNLDDYMAGGERRQTFDMDKFMQGDDAQQSSDFDYGLEEQATERSTNRDTFNLDDLMNAPGPGAFTPAATNIAPLSRTIGPGTVPEPQDNRHTLNLDDLWGDGGVPSAGGASLEPAVSFGGATNEQTMRPVSHYPHQQYQQQDFQQQQFEGHDFAASQPQVQASHVRKPSRQPRPMDFDDVDNLMGSNLDALMAGDHDYEEPEMPATLAHGHRNVAEYRASADLGMSSSPPQSPYGGPLSHLPPIPNYPAPINPLVLHDGAPPELVQAELQRLLQQFSGTLDLNHMYLTEATKLAPPARQSQGPSNGNGYVHSRTTSVASSIRDGLSSRDEGTEGDREDD